MANNVHYVLQLFVLLSVRPSVRPSIHWSICLHLFVFCDISLPSGRISMKGINIHHMSGCCWKGFQGQRSNVKVMTTSSTITAKACSSTVWRRGVAVERRIRDREVARSGLSQALWRKNSGRVSHTYG